MLSAAKGAASPWFEVRAQKPADGESEPNYWLGYASGPRTDQHLPSYKGQRLCQGEEACREELLLPRRHKTPFIQRMERQSGQCLGMLGQI